MATKAEKLLYFRRNNKRNIFYTIGRLYVRRVQREKIKKCVNLSNTKVEVRFNTYIWFKIVYHVSNHDDETE